MIETAPAAIKSQLRAAASARRNALPAEMRAQLSITVADAADTVIRDAAPAVVSVYWPIRSECDPKRLIRRVRARGIDIALPVVMGEALVFRRWGEGDPLVLSSFGTYEPAGGARIVTPDLIVLPLLGFDRFGNRLGYGKGHYDRAIASLRQRGHAPSLLGLAFSGQEVADIPVEPHDIRLDWIVTETGVLRFGAG